MSVLSVAIPANELFTEYSQSNHGELELKPIWLEQQKMISDENDVLIE